MKEVWLYVTDVVSRDNIILGLVKSGHSVRYVEKERAFWVIVNIPEVNIKVID